MSKPEQRALVPTLKAGNRALGIIPQTFDDCFRLAQCAAMSGTIPNGHDQTPEAITMVILYGLELGIPPIQSMQNITKINGKFCIYGDLVPALLWSHDFDIEQTIEGEGDAMKAVCTITRPNGKKITRDFSVSDAKIAKLWGKSGPWLQFPKRMLGWRALGFAKSDGAADIMRGLAIVEVERDITLTDRPVAAVLDVPDAIEDGPETGTDQTPKAETEAEASQDMPFPDPAKYLAHLSDELAAASDKEIYEEIWAAHNDGSDGRLSQSHQDAAKALYEKHGARFETKPAAKKKPKGKDEGGELL